MKTTGFYIASDGSSVRCIDADDSRHFIAMMKDGSIIAEKLWNLILFLPRFLPTESSGRWQSSKYEVEYFFRSSTRKSRNSVVPSC